MSFVSRASFEGQLLSVQVSGQLADQFNSQTTDNGPQMPVIFTFCANHLLWMSAGHPSLIKEKNRLL